VTAVQGPKRIRHEAPLTWRVTRCLPNMATSPAVG
jgi:hypothetical protein